MPGPRTKKLPHTAYTEEQATRWLSWLARGMQKHGQTVFLIEQLQPSWLTSRLQLGVYALLSRIVVGMSPVNVVVLLILVDAYLANVQRGKPIGEILVKAMVICVAGLLFGFGAAGLDLWRLRGGRFWALVDGLGTRWRSFAYVASYFVALVSLSHTLGYLLLEGVVHLKLGSRMELKTITYSIIFLVPCLALIGSLFWGPRAARQGQGSDIGTVETLGWSWASARKGVLQGFRYGLGALPLLLLSLVLFARVWILPLMCAVGAGLGLITSAVAGRDVRKAVRRGGKAGLVGGLLITVLLGIIAGIGFLLEFQFWLVVGVGLLFLLCGGVIGGVFCGLQSKIVATKTLPNQGIRLSLRNALVGGCLVAVPIGLAGGIAGVFVAWLARLAPGTAGGNVGIFAALYALAAALVAGIFGALWYGGVDCLFHFVLRLILFSGGVLPLRLSRFLDYAADELHFLQKVGGGYMFIHRYLQEHFAALGEPTASEGERAAEPVAAVVAAIRAAP